MVCWLSRREISDTIRDRFSENLIKYLKDVNAKLNVKTKSICAKLLKNCSSRDDILV